MATRDLGRPEARATLLCAHFYIVTLAHSPLSAGPALRGGVAGGEQKRQRVHSITCRLFPLLIILFHLPHSDASSMLVTDDHLGIATNWGRPYV